VAGPTGIEPATYGLRVRRSSLTELRAHMASFEKVFIEGYRAYGCVRLGLAKVKTNMVEFALVCFGEEFFHA
jgi:hypothetical protein